MSLPNLVIVGAPKSGTTSLYRWLQAHPSVVTSRVKETYYLVDAEYTLFNADSNYLTGGIEGYSKLFPEYQPGQVCMEATPENMYQQTALKVLCALPTRPLVVFILRNPVDRVLSLVEYAKNNIGSLDVNLSTRDFFELVEKNKFTEDSFLNNALLYSKYHIWLEAWLQAFTKSGVEVFFFEELVDTPRIVVNKICNRMGIDSGFYKDFEFKPENQSRQIRSPLLLQVKRVVEQKMPMVMRSDIAKSWYRAINFKVKSRKQESDFPLINEMYEYFAEANQKLALILGRELPAGWSNHYANRAIGTAKLEGGSRFKGVKKESQPGKPLITIITATFNASEYLSHTIKSVREQVYDNIEWIVVDAASKDATVELLRRNEDVIDYWVSEPDSGVYDAWNKGVLLARGEWIGFLGGDDVFVTDAIQQYVHYILGNKDKQVDYISSRVGKINVQRDIVEVVGNKWEWTLFQRKMNVAHVGSLHHRSLYDRYGLYDTTYKIVGDYEFLLRSQNTLQAGFIDHITVHMLMGGISERDVWIALSEARRAKINTGARLGMLCFLDNIVDFMKVYMKRMVFKRYRA